jgi:glycosyltransferase involved in cell wall biosynthesis
MNQSDYLSLSNKPFFSIGITTYNRLELLKQTIKSFLSQEYLDFEIIIGNDFIEKPLTSKMLGFNDSRITILNNRENLGELQNMNNILNNANGKYFSWHFDDDYCAPNLLLEVYNSLCKTNFPICCFTSYDYIYGPSSPADNINVCKTSEYISYSGKEFLRTYLSGKIKVLGLGGFYKSNYLTSLGGAPKLCDGRIALYSEYLLLIKTSELPKIIYINSKLVYCRIHNNSLSAANLNVELFKKAGINLIKESLPIISNNNLIEDFGKNLESLCNSVICALINKSNIQNNKLKKIELDEFTSAIQLEFNNLKPNLAVIANKSLSSAKRNIFWFKIKDLLKKNIQSEKLKIIRFALSYVSKYTNKSF